MRSLPHGVCLLVGDLVYDDAQHRVSYPSEAILLSTISWQPVPFRHQSLTSVAPVTSVRISVDRSRMRMNVWIEVCRRRTMSRATCWTHDDHCPCCRQNAGTLHHRQSFRVHHLLHLPCDQHCLSHHYQSSTSKTSANVLNNMTSKEQAMSPRFEVQTHVCLPEHGTPW